MVNSVGTLVLNVTYLMPIVLLVIVSLLRLTWPPLPGMMQFNHTTETFKEVQAPCEAEVQYATLIEIKASVLQIEVLLISNS